MYDENQIRAIRHLDGPALVIAGPGAGKTYTIVSRIIHMVRNAHIPPEDILVITFTRAAAKEMQQRYCNKVGTDGYGVAFGTFHSIYYSILKDSRLSNSIKLIDEKTKKYLVSKSASLAGIKPENIPEGYARLLGAISSIKNTGKKYDDFTFAEISPKQLEIIFEEYEQSKQKLDRIDFDDMITMTHRLLSGRKDILKKYRDRYRYILVDEAQDMNRIQFDVIRLIAEPLNNLFLVGDDDQSIYAFRGADSKIMLSFSDFFSDGKIITLNNNFRSAPGIIEAAGNVICHNSQRFEKNYTAVKSIDAKIRYFSFENDKDEAEWLGKRIKQEINHDSDANIGVLFRNHRQSENIRQVLESLDINYNGKNSVKGSNVDFTTSIITDYLKTAVFGYKRDIILRVMNVPERFLPREGLDDEVVSFDKWSGYHQSDRYTVDAIQRFYSDLNRIKTLSTFGAISYIVRKIGFEKYASENNIADYRKSIDHLIKLSKDYPDKKLFIQKLKEEKDQNNSSNNEEGSNVFLYTFHASKGLEFDSVYIIDASEDITPSRFAKGVEQMEEERRMFYVAMTRAKRNLTIMSAKKTGKQETYPSRFVKEMSKKPEATRQEGC